MMGHKICFCWEIRKIIFELSSVPPLIRSSICRLCFPRSASDMPQSSRYWEFFAFLTQRKWVKMPTVSNRWVKKTPTETRIDASCKNGCVILRMFWSQKIFFSNSRKIFPTKEMHWIALMIVPVKNWPQRSKRFSQPLKSKSQPQMARADRLTYWPKLMQFLVGVHYTLGFARKTRLSLRVCSIWFVYVYAHVRIRWNMNSHSISCAIWFW